MRRTVVVLALLALCLPAAAADKPWPVKGDVVFVSADLVYSAPGFSFTGGAADKESPVPSCIAMTVRKVKTAKPTWIVGPVAGAGTVRLDGDWTTRFHRDSASCETGLSVHGQPKITRAGWVHTIHLAPTSTAPSD